MKTAIISGGSSGIGLATCQHLLQAGYQVFILDIQAPKSPMSSAYYVQCDLANNTEIFSSIQKISQQASVIDALICNAGIFFSATIQNTTEQDYTRVMDINFKSAFFLTQAVLPLMISQKHGAIVYVGSDQTLIGKHSSAVYGASKAALGSLVKTTALDYALYNIRANLVAPGTIDTPLYRNAIARYCERTGIPAEEVHASEAKQQPLGRIGTAAEVANLIAFLCSDAASFITGGIYPVDGGYTAG